MRPELTEAQAAGYTAARVLGNAVQPFSATRTIRISPDRPLQGAINAAIRAAKQAQDPTPITLDLAPGAYQGPVLLPAVTVAGHPLRLAIHGQGARITAALHIRLAGAAYARAFGGLFQDAPCEVRTLYDQITSQPEIGAAGAAVLRVLAPGTQLSGLTIVNTYNCDRTGTLPPEEGALSNAAGQWSDETHQAFALHLQDADGATCRGLTLSSFQDTLYLDQTARAARYLLSGCTVYGDIDFVFGPATAFFEACEIRTRASRSPNAWAVAPSTPADQPHGLVFDTCRFSHDGAPAGRFKLGRQWFHGVRATPYGRPPCPGYATRLGPVNRSAHPHGMVTSETLLSVGKCVILRSRIGAHIDPETPWDAWKGPEYHADGTRNTRAWSPAYRPAQYTGADLLRHLAHWPDLERLPLDRIDPEAIFLAEFNNCPDS